MKRGLKAFKALGLAEEDYFRHVMFVQVQPLPISALQERSSTVTKS